MSNTCLNGRTWCWFRLKMRFATLSGLDVMSLSFSLSVPFASLFMASFDAHSSFFACTKWWNCGWQTSFLESLDKFNLQKVCGEWQNWQWTQFFPKCLAFCVYSGFQEWSQNDQNGVPAETSIWSIWSIPVKFAAYQLHTQGHPTTVSS